MLASSSRKYFLLGICLCLISILCSPKSWAQSPSLQARTDVQEIVIGDQLKMFIDLQFNAKTHMVLWPKWVDTFNHLEIVERSGIDTQKQQDVVTLKQTLSITGFDSGAYEIPAFAFVVKDKVGNADTIYTAAQIINVQTVNADTSKPFKGIKDIVAVPASWTDYLPAIGLGLLAVAVIALLIYLYKRKKKTAGPSMPVIREKYWERSERLLRELDAQQLWAQGQVKEYYTQLSDILRDYLESRFSINAKEQTTEEINGIARKLPEMRPYRKAIRDVLLTADLAKFAKAEPLPEEHMQAMNEVKDFIAITKPKPENTTKPS